MTPDDQNTNAWNSENYEAWVNRFGSPEIYALKLLKEPKKIIESLLVDMGDVNDKKIVNLMGSNGNKAVALSLLGAQVTVVDFSKSNEKYALELAHCSGTHIDYIVSDVMSNDLQPLFVSSIGLLQRWEFYIISLI